MSAKDRAHLRQLQDEGTAEAGVSEQDVVDYLKANPGFFRRHEDLLCEMQVPHGSGSAISLVERQVALLRERNIEIRHRLGHIVETARDNDRLFEKTRQLVLLLLEADEAGDLIAIAAEHLRQELGADFCTLKLFDPEFDTHFQVDEDVARQALPALFQQNGALCGQLREAEYRFLFGDDDAIESAAVIPLEQDGATVGILAVGSSDATYFHRDMGTLFLDFVADVILRRLRQCRDG